MIPDKLITVIPLADSWRELTLESADALLAADRLMLRTSRHPVSAWLREKGKAFDSLDALYARHDDFDALNAALASAVLDAAPCVYAVADPETDRSVRQLIAAAPQGSVRVLPGVSRASRALAASALAGESVISVSAADVPAMRLNPLASLIVSEIDGKLSAGEVKLKLLTLYPPELEATLGSSSGVSVMPLSEIDRVENLDHTTWLCVPPVSMMDRGRRDFFDLVDVMTRLRDPEGGCPWDIEQDHRSLREYILEEACEVIEAIDLDDPVKLADELGDALLQVVFHADVSERRGGFDIMDVTSGICEKLIRRHPHIFGSVKADTSEQVLVNWEAIKKQEKKLDTQSQVMRDVPRQLPALMRAAKVQKKAKAVGFDFAAPEQALEKVLEEAGETARALEDRSNQARLEEELGDMLFAAVNVSRLAGVQPELALTASTDKFIRRFEKMEGFAAKAGRDLRGMAVGEQDRYWEMAKAEEVSRE